MVAKVLRVEFPEQPQQPRTIEDVLGEVMTEARRRAGMTPAEFAEALNERGPRRLGLMDTTVEAYEAGRVPPPGDVLCRSMELSGHDVVAALLAWIRGTSQAFPLRGAPSAAGAATRASAPR